MRLPGSSRQRLAQALNAAYADGLLSASTLSHRLDLLFRSRLVDPVALVGDLTGRTARSPWRAMLVCALANAGRGFRTAVGLAAPDEPMLLTLDWGGAQEELILGRHPLCDVVLWDLSVSRWHARLRFHDGAWTLRDLDSTNGTRVNGASVGRCALRPGDRLTLGSELLLVD